MVGDPFERLLQTLMIKRAHRKLPLFFFTDNSSRFKYFDVFAQGLEGHGEGSRKIKYRGIFIVKHFHDFSPAFVRQSGKYFVCGLGFRIHLG